VYRRPCRGTSTRSRASRRWRSGWRCACLRLPEVTEALAGRTGDDGKREVARRSRFGRAWYAPTPASLQHPLLGLRAEAHTKGRFNHRSQERAERARKHEVGCPRVREKLGPHEKDGGAGPRLKQRRDPEEDRTYRKCEGELSHRGNSQPRRNRLRTRRASARLATMKARGAPSNPAACAAVVGSHTHPFGYSPSAGCITCCSGAALDAALPSAALAPPTGLRAEALHTRKHGDRTFDARPVRCSRRSCAVSAPS
jgi:hypothetical protein